MNRSIDSSLYQLLTGGSGNGDLEKLIEETATWDTSTISIRVDSLPVQYFRLVGNSMSNYMGLAIYSRLSKLFQDDGTTASHKDIVLKCQQKAMYYHNIQYVPDQVSNQPDAKKVRSYKR